MEKDLKAADKTTIFNEAGHIRNRDEIATSGNRVVQGGSASDIDDTWEFERKDHLATNPAESHDAVDAQLRNMEQLHEDMRESTSHRAPTLAKPAYEKDVLRDMSAKDLKSIADALGIPDRQRLSHLALVQKIREYEARGL